jgi:hypothetical protein
LLPFFYPQYADALLSSPSEIQLEKRKEPHTVLSLSSSQIHHG